MCCSRRVLTSSPRGLVQTDSFNASDAHSLSGRATALGSNNNCILGPIQSDTWHRIVWAVRAAPGEGQGTAYIDGRVRGRDRHHGSGSEERWALLAEVLLFTMRTAETNAGYLASQSRSSIGSSTFDEAVAPAGVNAGGADSARSSPFQPENVTCGRHARPSRRSSGRCPENMLVATSRRCRRQRGRRSMSA